MFTAPHFQNHDEARKYLEALRWAGEPVCPHCGTVGKHYATKKAGVWAPCATARQSGTNMPTVTGWPFPAGHSHS